MNSRRELFERAVAALERIAPHIEPPANWHSAPAFVWTGKAAQTLPELQAHPLDTLRGIERQKQAVLANIERLAHRHAAHDMLLWGARGMGKSALLQAACAQVQSSYPGKLAVIQAGQDALYSLPDLLGQLRTIERAFLIYVDDLGFGPNGTAEILHLRSVLEGGIAPRPSNVRFAVTANRRSIVKRSASQQTGATGDSGLNERDERDDALALADRFGLSLGFHPCDRETYLDIVRAYCDPLSLEVDEEDALAWSINRGALSGRAAFQYAVEVAGRAGKSL